MQTKGVKGGRSYLPFAFTESGIYMLMTVLKGDLAVKQSKALIRTFRAMKDYIIENQDLVACLTFPNCFRSAKSQKYSSPARHSHYKGAQEHPW